MFLVNIIQKENEPEVYETVQELLDNLPLDHSSYELGQPTTTNEREI